MKFCHAVRPLYLETNASSASLGVGLLNIRYGMNYGNDEVLEHATLPNCLCKYKPIEY